MSFETFVIPKRKNNPNFFRTANDPHLGRSYINPLFLKKLMNFGELLLAEKTQRKPNMNLYLAALQLDQGIFFGLFLFIRFEN